jgi:hypothetical protein
MRLPEEYILLSYLSRGHYDSKRRASGEHSTPHPMDGARPASIQHMRRDHRRLYICVAQEFLHRPDIVALLEQMRRTAVPQGMTTEACGEPSRTTGPTDGPLPPTLIGVMAADDPRPWVFR